MQITVFDIDTNFDRFRDRLDSYAYESKNVKVEYVDIDRQPARAKQAEVQTAGTIVVSYKDRVQRITNTEEQDITNALIKRDEPAAEEGLLHAGPRRARHGGLRSARLRRRSRRRSAATTSRVEKLVLAQQKDVPADATVVVIAGPQHRLPRAGDRRAQELSRQGRQGAGDARSAGAERRRS